MADEDAEEKSVSNMGVTDMSYWDKSVIFFAVLMFVALVFFLFSPSLGVAIDNANKAADAKAAAEKAAARDAETKTRVQSGVVETFIYPTRGPVRTQSPAAKPPAPQSGQK